MDKSPKRDSAELYERIRDALAEFPNAVDVTGPGGEMWPEARELLWRSPEEEAAEREAGTAVWQPTSERPADYPATLPFLPGSAAVTNIRPGRPDIAVAMWPDMPAAEQSLERLLESSLADGWTLVAAPASLATSPHVRHYLVRDRTTRVLSLAEESGHSSILLTQVERGDTDE
jgi:hypothetical protein